MRLPRFLITAAASGSGKTLITCGILQLLKNRGYQVTSFKCGPDYIDPMFHSKVIGMKSRNLDPFFADRGTLRGLMEKNAQGSDIAVVEGVMGYYDGLAGISAKGSAWDVADETDTPAVFLVNCKGMSLSVIPYLKGFLEYQRDSHIKGVILNQLSPMMYGRLREQIEEELPIKVCGYVPYVKDCTLESRHLGLVMPDEIDDLRQNLMELADILEKSLDVDALLSIAGSAPEISGKELRPPAGAGDTVRIALASDEAFCFFYEDNLQLLREMGAELVPFSPIHDKALPADICGLLLHGGYPELFAGELSENKGMRMQIRDAVLGGLPCMAECGGFMYLHDRMQGHDGSCHDMAGVIEGTVYKTSRLRRFGYITLSGGTVFGKDIGTLRSHEFHYYDSENCGDAFLAEKPLSDRSFRCLHSTDTLFAGYPHMYYYSNIKLPEAFLATCMERKNRG